MIAGAAQAVPAYPGLIPMTQPDGTVVNVQLHGDEHGSYMLTEDGYLLTEVNRTLHYADVDAQGRVVASPFVATSPEARSADAQKFLKRVDMSGTVMPAVMANLQAEQIRMEHERQRVGALGLFPKRNFPAFGHQKAIVILVEFDEAEFTVDNPRDYFTRMLNEDGFSDWGGEGSAAQWYREQSSGQFLPEFDVYGPVKMPKPMKFYGERVDSRNDLRGYMLPIHACQALDAEVDFSQYDRDEDGYIDNVFMFYAGLGENSGGSGDTLWPHSWDLSYAAALAQQNGDGDITNYVFDGKKLEHYGMTNEWFGATNRPDGIGTFCHEFGHILGLPDLYNTQNQRASFTPDTYDTMDRGSYNNNSCTPPNFSVFERHALGWLEPLTLTGEQSIRLQPITTNTGIYLPTPNKTEYYLLENRQKTGWDKYIPGEGMLIWHIDYDSQKWYSNVVNNVNTHQCVDLVEADGRTSASTRHATPFPGTNNVTEFTNYTVPSMRTWDGKDVAFPLTEIAQTPEGNIVFNVSGGKKHMEPLEVEVTDIHHQGFTLSWTPTNRANNYLVTVTDGEGEAIEGLNRVPVGLTTSFAVTGLEPSTTYKAHVIAAGNYEESDPKEVAVTTGEDTFRNYATVVSAPENVTDRSFVISWEAVEGAVDYQLNLYTKTRGEAAVETLGFDNGIDDLPGGWTTNSTMAYTSKSNSGKNPGSLRCSDSGTHITSPCFTDDIHSLSFWARLTIIDGGTAEVYALVDGAWSLVEDVKLSNKGADYLVDNLPAGTRSVKIVYNRTDVASSLAIDDIEINWGGEFTTVPVVEYVDRLTGNVTTFTVGFANQANAPLFVADEDADADADYNTYYYNVKAVNAAGEVSRPSNEQSIKTTSTVGIADVNFGSAFTVAVAGRTLIINGAKDGVTIATPSGASIHTAATSVSVPAGIYIVSDGVKAHKVVVK